MTKSKNWGKIIKLGKNRKIAEIEMEKKKKSKNIQNWTKS